MKPRAYVGADPGLSGALALYVPDANAHANIDVLDMPTLMIGDKRVVDLWGLARLIEHWRDIWDSSPARPMRAVIERVHAIPNYTRRDGKTQGMSSSASFNFGFAAGSLQQAFASARVPFTLIAPATWKAIYGLQGGRENKDASRRKASQLFPQHADKWPLKKHDGRAEAVLLAHYGSKLQ